MMWSLAGLAKAVVLSAVWLIFLAIFIVYTAYFWTRVTSWNVVHIESFIGVGSTEDVLGPYVAERARELSARVPLDGLYEVIVPPLAHNFGTKDSITLPSEAKVSVGGFDLMAVAKAFANVFPNDRYTVSARPDTASSGTALHLEWRAPSGAKRHWLLAIEDGDGVKREDKAAVNRVLIDRAIYTLLYHMYYSPDGAGVWSRNDKPKAPFRDARALEAYYVGQQHLSAYLHTRRADELERAEREFRILEDDLPRFGDGLILLGLTLSERRKERDAIIVYESAERALEQALKGPVKNVDRVRNNLFQARLFKAVAHRRLYNWRDAHIAIGEFDRLASEIRERLKTQPNNNDLKKILATALAEKANTIGYYLILLWYGNFIEAITHPLMPGSLSLTAGKKDDLNGLQKALEERYKEVQSAPNDATAKDKLDKLREQRNEELRTVLGILFEDQRRSLKEAEDYVAEIKSSDPKLVSVLRSADGYTLFRDAQAREDDDSKFRKKCDEALANHRLADDATPNHYLVLQNMGMIYADPRYDRENRYIETARRLFKRSVRFKPDDYFGNQNLAALAIREANRQAPEFVKPELIKEGVDAAEKARDIAPGNWVAFIQLAQLYALRWARETDAAKKQADEILVQATLATAKGLKDPNVIRLEAARLQWELLRLRAETDPKKFEVSKVKLRKSLGAALETADQIPGWEKRKLVTVVGELKEKLTATTFENRLELRWPY